VSWADGVEVASVERRDLGHAEAFGDGEIRDRRWLSRAGDASQKLRFDAGAGLALEEVADLTDDGCRHEDLTACQMQSGEQVRAFPVVSSSRSAAATRGAVSQMITQDRPRPSARMSSWLLPRSRRPLAKELNTTAANLAGFVVGDVKSAHLCEGRPTCSSGSSSTSRRSFFPLRAHVMSVPPRRTPEGGRHMA
jgi:hypothetical protein